MKKALLAAILTAATSAGASAADLFRDDVTSVLRTETLSAEAFVGYVSATSTEYVHDQRQGKGGKLSQLDWDISHALAVGGRVAYRPLDWLTLRGRGWTTVTSDSQMRDYDWLAGYYGFNSYTHISVHPNTVVPQAWQLDASAAATVWQDDSVALSLIGGFRHYQAKFEAKGGSYLYSVNGFRDTSGTFAPNQVGITYRQTFDAPYLGFGVSYATGAWALSGELVGSPVVIANANDDHHLRTLNIKSKFDTSAMVGASGAIEYKLTDHLSAVGRFEYQRFSEAKGSARYHDSSTGLTFVNPKPGSGAEADTALVSLGLKGRFQVW